MKILTSWVQIIKDVLPPIVFRKVLGVWKLPNWQCSGLNYARFEEFIHNAERLTRIMDTIQFELRLMCCINFVRFKFFHFDIVQNLYSFECRDIEGGGGITEMTPKVF